MLAVGAREGELVGADGKAEAGGCRPVRRARQRYAILQQWSLAAAAAVTSLPVGGVRRVAVAAQPREVSSEAEGGQQAELGKEGPEQHHEPLVERRPRDGRRWRPQRLVAQAPALKEHCRGLLGLEPERRADERFAPGINVDVNLKGLRDVLPPRFQLVVYCEQLLRLDVEPPVDAAAPQRGWQRHETAMEDELRGLLDAVADDQLQLLWIGQLLLLRRFWRHEGADRKPFSSCPRRPYEGRRKLTHQDGWFPIRTALPNGIFHR